MAYDLDRSDAERFSLLMRSGHGLIVMETHEERRGVRLVMEAAASIEQRCWAWSMVRGLVPLDRREGQMASGTNDPTAALLHLISLTDRWVAIMADLQRHLDDPKVIRAAREAAEQAHRNGSTLVLLGPAMELPAELQRLAFPFPLTLPDTAFFEKLVKRVYREVLADNQQIEHELKREDFTRLTESLIGLTEIEAERIIRQVILEDGRLDARDVDRVRNAKRATIASHGQLEVLPVADNLDSLGGHDRLKDWLRKRRAAMSSKGREFGIEPPRGVLLLGVPGCGKSFCARLVAGEWRRPLLRLDVSGEDAVVPADNPFVEQESARPEIWAYGLRNPWRFSFDRLTGQMWIADVGQNLWEEVNVQPAGSRGGENYGWPIMEGTHCFQASTCDREGLTLPVAEYSHDLGCSITGGYVYRGAAQPALQGVYFYGDYCSGRIWGVAPTADGAWQAAELLESDAQISSFGETEDGELVVVDYAGNLFRLVHTGD